MTEPLLTKEGQEALNSVFIHRASITRQQLREKIFRSLSLLMNEQGCEEAGRDLVIEAAEMAIGKSSGALFLRELRDPEEYQRRLFDRYYSREAYYAGPYFVRRWDSLHSKPTKRPEEMKVLAISASPRVRGNTSLLVDEALRGAKDAGAEGEKIILQKLKIKDCNGCRKCKLPDFEPICIIKDDMSNIYPKVIDSDAIILGFPIYGFGPCSQLITLLDRFYGLVRCRTSVKSSDDLVKQPANKRFESEMPFYSILPETVRRGMVIGVWGTPYSDMYDDIMVKVINGLSEFNIETVEAISACGFVGILHGVDEKGKGVIARFPKELEKAYLAGKSLVTGEG